MWELALQAKPRRSRVSATNRFFRPTDYRLPTTVNLFRKPYPVLYHCLLAKSATRIKEPRCRNLSHELFVRAQARIPGGVNSPVRAFSSVGGEPLFFDRAEGACIFDVDGKRYIDYIGSWGPMICGHAHPHIIEAVQRAVTNGLSFGTPSPGEVTMAERICELVPSLERVRMVNSGTEAAMSALRLARAATGRKRFIKFEGNYHGHADSFLVKAGSGAQTLACRPRRACRRRWPS